MLCSTIITKENSKWTKGEKVMVDKNHQEKHSPGSWTSLYYEKDDENCKWISLINSMLQKIQDTNPTNL